MLWDELKFDALHLNHYMIIFNGHISYFLYIQLFPMYIVTYWLHVL